MAHSLKVFFCQSGPIFELNFAKLVGFDKKSKFQTFFYGHSGKNRRIGAQARLNAEFNFALKSKSRLGQRIKGRVLYESDS